ncbi:MAG: hypothetical protein EON90_12590 [Brevundimonas sp.]|nr:MAG: hypothetical protein EON90_12590 [Brevundimonas sp.]
MSKFLDVWQVGPHGHLHEMDEGLLSVAGEIVMPLGRFPRRMTVIRLSGGRTAIWSAVALEEPQMRLIEAEGTPTFLIVPNPGHRTDVRIWKKRYPDLRVVTPPGAVEAVTEAVPVDATEDVLDDADVDFVVVDGTAEAESALIVRRPAGTTLITNDIIGHVTHPHGLGANIMARLFDYGVDEPAVPRTIRRFIKDPKALAAQMRGWADLLKLKRIIVSHVDPITEDPAGTLRRLADEVEG